jgi:large subunit ribosomal protein L6
VSRIGKKPIVVPGGVKVNINQDHVSIQGPKGKLEYKVNPGVSVVLDENKIKVSRSNDDRETRARQGLVRAMLNNMVKGVHEGFQRVLEISGVGYRAELKGRTLVLYLGYSGPKEFQIPESIEVSVDKAVRLVVRGADKEKVGTVAAKIRAFRKPDPYKVKGIKYEGEVIRKKAGKKAIGT